MDRFGLRAASFCEHCGLHRDQLGDETLAPFRECPSCARAVCPNCWNIVGNACLRCAPFALPISETPTAGVLAADAAPVMAAGPAAPKSARSRRGKREPATAVVAASAAAAVVGASPSTPPTPKQKTARGIKTPKLPAPRRSAKAAAVPVAAVEWPDRSVDWQTRPGTVVQDAPRPAPARAAAPVAAAAVPVSPKSTSTRPGRPGRLTSLVGFLVVAVALFGVAGISLAALGRLPGPHRAVSTAAPEPPTAAPPVSTDGVTPSIPVIVGPGTGDGVSGPAPVAGGDSGGAAPAGGADTNPGPDETTTTGGAGFGSTPKPTAEPTATPTAEPTPEPTPTPDPPTPQPTPTPDPPTPEPTPTPDPPTPEP